MRISVTFFIFFTAVSHVKYSFAQTAVTPVLYNIPGAVYTQNFDGLPNTGSFSLSGKGPVNLNGFPINGTGLNGWQLLMTGGSNTNAVFVVGTGSSTGNGLYSLGNTGSTERALGSLSSGSGIYSAGLVLTNNTGAALNTFTISFTIEQWRKGGSTNKNTWAFRFKTGVLAHINQTEMIDEPNLNMNSVITTSGAGSLNGNLAENGQLITCTVDSLNWKNGEQLLLRWDDIDEPGNDDVCAIDNFNFLATLVSDAPTALTIDADSVTTHAAVLHAFVKDNFSPTAVAFEFDTTNSFLHPTTINAVPDTVHAGAGNTHASAMITGLQAGHTYFFRVKTSNAIGNRNGPALSFITPFNLPTVTTNVAAGISTNTADLGGNISPAGGSAVTERGIVWSENINPTLSDNKIIIGNGTGNFSQQVTGLPPGTKLYARAYATNIAGTAYGNNESVTTQTSIVSLICMAPFLTNASSVIFTLKTAQVITGLSAGNFSLTGSGLTGASITGISGLGNTFTITIHTGSGEGTIGLQLVTDAGLSLPIHNKPYMSTGMYTIDKTPPVIRYIKIPDRPMKTGDTISITVFVNPHPDDYKMTTGNINGFILSRFSKQNDSTYTGLFIIQNGGSDVVASANIPVSISLVDSMGNSALFQSTVSQGSDPIDANKPFISEVIMPSAGIYKAGDTLNFMFRFNEKIILSATAATAGFSVTVGTKVRFAGYAGGSGSDSIWFRYIIQSGESDKDGIKTGASITLINTAIKDLSGNTGSIIINNPPPTKNILIDGMIPAISGITVPPAAVYKTGNILDFLVTYTKKIMVTIIGGAPLITLNIGNKLRNATYINGSGGNVLLFRYMIEADDMDKDGIKLISPLVINTATIKDDAGNHASPELHNIGALSNIRINPVTAAVSSVTNPLPGIYRQGDTLEYMVIFTEKVWVTGDLPSIRLTIGSTSRQAFYRNGTGGNTLLFIYAIQPGDEDTNGVKIHANISLNMGFIKDEKGNTVSASLHNISNSMGIFVDAVSASIKNVITPDRSMYTNSDTLNFTVNFSKKVHVGMHIDTPYIKLFAGTEVKKIVYHKGSGTATLLFRYIIQKGDLDKNGIKLDTFITGNKCITDLTGNPAIPALKNVGALSNVKIDAVGPLFTAKPVTNLTVCENAAKLSINETLMVKDEEMGETLTWRVLSGANYGTVSKPVYNASSNGNTISPNNFLYKPNLNYYGQDTLVIEVSDGINKDHKTVTIQIQPALKNNSIGPSQIVCTHHTPAPITGSTPLGGNGVYQFTWEVSDYADSAGFNKAVGSNNLQHYLPERLAVTTWFRRKVVSGECVDVSRSSQVTVLQNGFWIGRNNADWHNGDNWCNGKVPDKLTDVFLYGNTVYDPEIKDTARCNHLTLFNNARLTISGTLELKGNIFSTNTNIDARKGSIIFNGTAAQMIPSFYLVDQTLKSLVIDNVSGISLPGPLFITGNVLLNSGSLITHDYLVLKSTAHIGPSATGTSIIGNVSIEHFIKGGRRAFRLLGHPFTQDIGLDMIKNSVDITGNNGSVNGFTPTATNQPSAFRFNTLTGNDSLGIEAGWMAFTHTNGQAENNWKTGTGIRLLVRGRPGQGLDGAPYNPLPVSLTLSGPVHTGDKEILLPKGKYATYHVLANPYASAIDLSLITRGDDVGMHYWVWNPFQANSGGYSSVPFKSKNILPPFGAFVVKTTGTAANTLLFTEHCKVNDTAADSLATLNNDDSYYLELRLESDSVFWDRLVLFATDSAKSFVDKNDAEKFQNAEVNFYSLSREQKMLSIDTRPITNETTIPLGVQAVIQGLFSIRVAKLSLPASNSLMLHDKYLGKWMKLEKDSSYHFIVTTDTLSKGNGRFEITAPKKIPPSQASKIIVKVSPVPATDKIVVTYLSPEKGNTYILILNLSGIPVKNIALGVQKAGQASISVGDMLSGIYLLEVKCGELTSTRKIIKK